MWRGEKSENQGRHIRHFRTRKFDIMLMINFFDCSSFLEMSCSSHLEMSRLELGKLAGSPSDHGAGDAPNSSGDI
ncbi:hypothetical protein, partial [Burkholderia cepacia]|uniref:hypothetical protein n=1 Tax=Burkholderia cepacia TaxID=292 RepID=UPI001CF5CE01